MIPDNLWVLHPWDLKLQGRSPVLEQMEAFHGVGSSQKAAKDAGKKLNNMHPNKDDALLYVTHVMFNDLLFALEKNWYADGKRWDDFQSFVLVVNKLSQCF